MAFKMNWVHGALAASLAANIFAGGYLLGKEIRPDRPPMEKRMGGKDLFSMRRLASYLPAEKRAELEALMKGHRDGLRENFDAIRESEDKVRSILLSDVVDKTALREALGELENRTRMMHGPLKAILLDIVADLDLETRQKLAEDMYKRRKWMVERRFGGRAGMPPPPPGGFDREGPEGGPPEGPDEGPEDGPGDGF